MALQYIPCAKNDNKGEQISRNYLMSFLAHTEGILLGNYHLPVNNSTLECDLILLNQRGVWVLEVKNWRGRIHIDRVKWKRNDGFIQHSPLISVETKAKTLSTMLENMRFRNISVTSFVILAQTNAELVNSYELQRREPHEDKVFHLDERLIRALSGRSFLHRPENRELNPQLIRQIADKLLPLSIDPEQEYIGDSYRILYDLGSGPDNVFHAYQAQHLNIPGRYARAKKYSRLDAFSTEDLENSIHRFRRDMQALVKTEDHPNIVRVYNYQPDPDNNDMYWLFVEWIKGITLQDRLNNGAEISFPDQLHILHSILEALDYCHSQGILHRNLTPACIYLADDGTVKLGDFDFARIPDLSGTLSFTGYPLLMKANRYMAPELWTDSRSADTRSDLYALGAIWYDMLVRPEPDEDIDLSQLEKTELSPDARDLLSRLLSLNPDERPRNARAVKRWLEQVYP